MVHWFTSVNFIYLDDIPCSVAHYFTNKVHEIDDKFGTSLLFNAGNLKLRSKYPTRQLT